MSPSVDVEQVYNGDGPLPPPHTASVFRKYTLLGFFCIAQFLDTFSVSSLITGIPQISEDLGLSISQATWLISAFSLTFAAFLLVSGRISDVYSPKVVFVVGLCALGLLSLGAGFIDTKIPLIVIRAICGIAGSMTIPSALSLLVALFPQPVEQSRAIALFGGCGALGNVLGLVIGAVFVQFATWHWVFWFVTIVSVPVSIISIFLIPRQPTRAHKASALKRLDVVGVSILTVALVLLIFAVTQGSQTGWGTAGVIAPLVISIVMIVAFFIYEKMIPEDIAAVPPRTWFYPNFAALWAASLLPYFFWTTQSTIFTELWQEVYLQSPISAAVHTIPSSVAAFLLNFTGPLQHKLSPKWFILFGQILMMVAAVLGTQADGQDKYWRFDFPLFILGSAGAQFIFTHTNVAIFRTTPPEMAGTVGALFNGGLQLGSAVGLAIATSIQSSVSLQHGDINSFTGRAAAYWFIFAAAGIGAVGIAVWYRLDRSIDHQQEAAEVQMSGGTSQSSQVEEK